MDDDPPDDRPPRLRGLAPSKLLGVLEGMVDPPPEIPGWHVLGVAGSGGFGTVWKATRERDGALAAVKLARPDDPETLERIESEAAILAALDHPDIVRLLDSGPVDDNEGGLFLAMEFIDGSDLSQLIPAAGLEPDQACTWFLRIAAAVAHAHDAGILHRDLKPGNILVDASGGIHVADFGLALPVHRRVHHLSLTRAGMVAGTAEYLPPEAYHRSYRPAVATDVFALGVILHEMLRGTPPRGAWPPVSRVRQIDVRIDEIIRRALDPDPARRFPDVRVMMAELERILASPPRYDGAPLVSRSIHAADCLWTLLGIAALWVTLAGVDHYNRSTNELTRPFLGVSGRLLGGFIALFLGLMLLFPASLWQILRLRKFRGVPLREALPAPFGLPLSFSRTAAVVVAVSQALLLVLPAVACFVLLLDTCGPWLRADDPPWIHGLAVTPWEDVSRVVSPWTFGSSWKRFWLIESFGPPGHPFMQPVGKIEFFPLVTPLLMVLAAASVCLAVASAAFAACRSWWHRNRCPAAVGFGTVVVATAVFALMIHAGESRDRIATRSIHPGAGGSHGRLASPATPFARALLGLPTPEPREQTLRRGVSWYADPVDFRDRGVISRSEIPPPWELPPSPEDQTTTIADRGFHLDWNPADHSFHVQADALVWTDAPDAHRADIHRVELKGRTTDNGGVSIHHERFIDVPLYRADRRIIDLTSAETWAAAFRAAVLAGDDPAAASWQTLFHPGIVRFSGDMSLSFAERGRRYLHGMLGPLVANPPRFLDVPVELRPALPGGRSRIAIPVHTNQRLSRRAWIADLIHSDGQWQAVDLFIESR